MTGTSPEVLALDIDESDRIVTSREPLTLRCEIIPQTHFKPVGLWYACGRSWMEWTYREGFEAVFNYVYRLHVNTDRLLQLTKLSELDQFQRIYGPEAANHVIDLNWSRVAQDFAGIEICPYQWNRRLSLMWYYTWDVASGCIWDTNIVCQVERLL